MVALINYFLVERQNKTINKKITIDLRKKLLFKKVTRCAFGASTSFPSTAHIISVEKVLIERGQQSLSETNDINLTFCF